MSKNKRKRPRKVASSFKRGFKRPVNKKIKNATETKVDGIQFKSKLEAYTYKQLKEAGITAHYEARPWLLMEGFRYADEWVRPIHYTPDFIDDQYEPGWIIEVKGYPTDTFKIKWKLFKKALKAYCDEDIPLYLPRNQKQVREAIEDILKRTNP